MSQGTIKKVAGPLVVAGGMRDANMFDVCLLYTSNRRAAVADSALDTGKHIIEERCGDTGKNDNKVRVSVVDDIRCV